MTSLVLKINGNSDSIRVMATWLGDNLSQTVRLAVRSIGAGGSESAFAWEGDSGSEFRILSERIDAHEPGIEQFANDVAEVFRAYAGRLERGREKFDRMLSHAADEGLTVRGNEILYPLTNMLTCPADNAAQQEIDQWNIYARKVKKYQEISSELGKWIGEHSAWGAEHLVPLLSQMGAQAEYSSHFDQLGVSNSDILQTVHEFQKESLSEQLSDMRENSKSLQATADEFSKNLKSGNPALRAAAQEANPREMTKSIEIINERIGSAGRVLKVLPLAGYAIDIVTAVDDLNQGAPHSSVGVGLLGAGAGAALGGWMGTAATATVSSAAATVAAPVVVAAVGAWAVGKGSVWLWEAAVPLDIRESIDAGIARDFEVVASANY